MQVIDTGQIQTAVVDSVVMVRRVGGITHVAFAETQPDIHSGQLQRWVSAKMIIPNDLVMLVARTILAGVTTSEWVMPDEEDTLGLRREH